MTSPDESSYGAAKVLTWLLGGVALPGALWLLFGQGAPVEVPRGPKMLVLDGVRYECRPAPPESP